jgi:hypothetical protein
MKMMRYTATIGLWTLAFSFTSCHKDDKTETNDQANEDATTTGKIQYSLKDDGRNWKLVNDDTQEQMRMTQFILADEQPENATELYTVTEMTDVNITPADYFSQFMTELQKRYSDAKVESKVINQQTNSLLGEWWVDGVSPDNTQHEWIRIIKKGNDIAILRYSTMRTDQLDQRRKAWESILSNAKFQ